MSDQDTMFDKESTQQETQQPTNQVPEFLAGYVGDDKKYKTVEDALQSVPNAQAHIDKLEQELAELRANDKPTVDPDQIAADIERRLLESMRKTPDAEDYTQVQTPETDQAQTGVDVNDIVTQVKSALEQEQSQKTSAENQKSVVQAAIAAWGESAESKLYSAAANYNMSQMEIDTLAAKNPTAALKLLGIESKANTASFSPTSSVKSHNHTQLTKPEPPTNWGNDAELVPYIRAMAEYEAAGGKL